MQLVLVNQNEELQKQLINLYSKTWLDPKFKYFHLYYYEPLTFSANGWEYEQYAVMNGECIIGFIDVSIITSIYAASIRLAINFTDDILTMGLAFQELIQKFFSRNFNKISWRGVDGNPILKNYQKMAEKYGGRQESHERYSVKLWDGTVADAFTWSVLREEYETFKSKGDVV